MTLQVCEEPICANQIANVENIENYVQSRMSGQIRDFRVQVRDDGLVLQGRSRTYYAKQLAQHAVMAVTRLGIAANNITVL